MLIHTLITVIANKIYKTRSSCRFCIFLATTSTKKAVYFSNFQLHILFISLIKCVKYKISHYRSSWYFDGSVSTHLTSGYSLNLVMSLSYHIGLISFDRINRVRQFTSYYKQQSVFLWNTYMMKFSLYVNIW